MTYRNTASYTRFPEKDKSRPTQSIMSASAQMDILIGDHKHRPRKLNDQTFVTQQNVYDAADGQD
jgi:hypothetical protein